MMIFAVGVAVAVPLLLAATAIYASNRYEGRIHLVWGRPSTLGDDELESEITEHEITQLHLSTPGPGDQKQG
jgi:hypothetical protein